MIIYSIIKYFKYNNIGLPNINKMRLVITETGNIVSLMKDNKNVLLFS